VHVVDVAHAGQRRQLVTYQSHVDVRGRGLHQDPHRLAAEPERPGHHEEPDRDGDQGVRVGPAGGQGHDAGEQDADRAEHVGEHLEVGPAQVQALLRAVAQQEEDHDVGCQPGGRGEHQRQAGDLGRGREPADGLDHHPAGHAAEQGGIGQRG